MSRILKYLIIAAVICALAIPTGLNIVKANKIPTFDIVSVVPDEVVTIQTYDFPAGKTFDVLIGKFGTYGLRGVKIATQNSEKGGSFTATYKIPDEFKGYAVLSIRLEDAATGYYAYNWFENRELPAPTPDKSTVPATTQVKATTVPLEEMKHPNFVISSVEADKSFAVMGSDFPVNVEFDVVMGVYGTMGIGGEKVTTQKTGTKGEFKATYQIPEALKGAYMIAVRMESATSEYYAFNYFFNATYVPVEETNPVVAVTEPAKTAGATEKATAATEEPGYQGYPYFSVTEVKKDTLVKVEAGNLPAGEIFDVIFGDFIGSGEVTYTAGTLTADKEGKASGSFTLPAELKGITQISIRLNGQKTGYFAYNYFFNQDFPVVEAVIEVTEAPATTPTAEAPVVEATPAPTETEAVVTEPAIVEPVVTATAKP